MERKVQDEKARHHLPYMLVSVQADWKAKELNKDGRLLLEKVLIESLEGPFREGEKPPMEGRNDRPVTKIFIRRGAMEKGRAEARPENLSELREPKSNTRSPHQAVGAISRIKIHCLQWSLSLQIMSRRTTQ